MAAETQGTDGDGPCTRGLAARAPLTQLDRFRPGTSEAVFEKIPQAALSAIEQARSLGWVAAEHERHVTGAIFDVLGDHDAAAYFRWITTRDIATTPLIRPIIDQIGRLFGADPGKLARIAPRPFHLLFRNFGQLVALENDSHWAVVELRDAAPVVFDHPAYGKSWRGGLGALFDLALTDGEVHLEVDEEARALRYRLCW